MAPYSGEFLHSLIRRSSLGEVWLVQIEAIDFIANVRRELQSDPAPKISPTAQPSITRPEPGYCFAVPMRVACEATNCHCPWRFTKTSVQR